MKYLVNFEIGAGQYIAEVEACSTNEFNELFGDLLHSKFGIYRGETPQLDSRDNWMQVPEDMRILRLAKSEASSFLIAVNGNLVSE